MKAWVILFPSLICFQLPLAGQGFFVVAPGSNSTNGNSGSILPFSYPVSRYQQVYSSTLFSSTAAGFRITNMAFRVDENAGSGIVGTYSRVQINLSTTQRQPNSLDPVFSNNIGLDNTTVFGPGSLSVVVSWPTSPGTFQFQIPFSNPFLYNPGAGNLLLDIQMLGSQIDPSSLDAVRGLNSGTSSLFSFPSGSSGTPDNLALVTRFGGVPVPEPSIYALAVIGGITFFLFAKRKRSRT